MSIQCMVVIKKVVDYCKFMRKDLRAILKLFLHMGV